MYYPIHINGFTDQSLVRTVERQKFKVIRTLNASMWSRYYDPFFLRNFYRKNNSFLASFQMSKHAARCTITFSGIQLGAAIGLWGTLRPYEYVVETSTLSGDMDNCPSFIGIGAPKCGTTWMFRCMQEHHEIYVPPEKEIGLFSYMDFWNDKEGKREWEIYQGIFAKGGSRKASGEIFVNYMAHPHVAQRVREHVPNAKLFASLRNPVEQIYSYYWHLKRQNFHQWPVNVSGLPKSFAEALETMPEKVTGPAFYARHLKRWRSYFPREQLHIMFFDDIKSDPAGELRKLFRHIGVAEDFVPASLTRKDASTRKGVSPRSESMYRVYAYLYDNLNRRVYHKLKNLIGVSKADRVKEALRVRQVMQKLFCREGYPKMSEAERSMVLDMVREDIMELEGLLGRNLSHWYL